MKATGEQKHGVAIVRKACEAPIRKIAENAGVDGSIVCSKVLEGEASFGFNAATEKYEDLVKAGVLDPTKVVRSALQNAASVAGLLLMTEVMITEKPVDEKANGHAHGGGGGMGDFGM